MGCFQSRDDYENPKFPEEKNIRKWEVELGFREKTFYEIISLLNSKIILEGEEISFKKLDAFLHQNFSNPDVSNIFQHNLFKTRDKTRNKIDCKYIKFLFLLMCTADKIPYSFSGSSKILDKVEYMYNIVTNGEEENFRRDELELMLEPLFIVSCDILPQSYINSKYSTQEVLEEEQYLTVLKYETGMIKDKFFQNLFGDEKKESMSLVEFNEKVLENPYVRFIFLKYFFRFLQVDIFAK
jgi:hypothetical protein